MRSSLPVLGDWPAPLDHRLPRLETPGAVAVIVDTVDQLRKVPGGLSDGDLSEGHGAHVG